MSTLAMRSHHDRISSAVRDKQDVFRLPIKRSLQISQFCFYFTNERLGLNIMRDIKHVSGFEF